jgi:hypothetical protein
MYVIKLIYEKYMNCKAICFCLYCEAVKYFNLVVGVEVHLVPRYRIRGALLPLPHYALMAWCLIKQ